MQAVLVVLIPHAMWMFYVHISSEQIILHVVTIVPTTCEEIPLKINIEFGVMRISWLTELNKSEIKHYGVCVCVCVCRCALPWKREDIFRQNIDVQRNTLYDRMFSCFHKTLVNTVVAIAQAHLILQVKNLVVRIHWQPCSFGWKSF